MGNENIYNALNVIGPLSPEAWHDPELPLEPCELKRNDFLVREGSQVKYRCMLLEGVVRVFYNKEGNEYNKTFFIPGMFPTPLTALLSGEPSLLSFQALLPSKLIRFSYYKFRELFSQHRCLETLTLRSVRNKKIKGLC